jgi:hypothetical protein
VSCGSGPRLPTREGSDAVTRLVASDLTRLGNGLRHRHMTYDSGPRRPAQEGSGTSTRSMVLREPRVVRIKKCLAATDVQRGSHVNEVCPHVTEVSTRRGADIIIITCKTCRHAATMPLYGAMSRCQSLAGVIGRSYDPIVRGYVADHA